MDKFPILGRDSYVCGPAPERGRGDGGSGQFWVSEGSGMVGNAPCAIFALVVDLVRDRVHMVHDVPEAPLGRRIYGQLLEAWAVGAVPRHCCVCAISGGRGRECATQGAVRVLLLQLLNESAFTGLGLADTRRWILR